MLRKPEDRWDEAMWLRDSSAQVWPFPVEWRWPQTIAGQKTRDFKAGQSLGTKATVITASDRKWRIRNTSRLVLSIG